MPTGANYGTGKSPSLAPLQHSAHGSAPIGLATTPEQRCRLMRAPVVRRIHQRGLDDSACLGGFRRVRRLRLCRVPLRPEVVPASVLLGFGGVRVLLALEPEEEPVDRTLL